MKADARAGSMGQMGHENRMDHMGHGPGDPWVMGQELNGSLGSWVP